MRDETQVGFIADRRSRSVVPRGTSARRPVQQNDCHRTGSFELDGERLRFGRMASTKMACPDGMEQEKRLLETLERVERYRIRGRHLELLDATGAVSARFEAVALK
jgi:hypothetical protein